MYQLKHIGLQVAEKDVQNFYQEVLDFEQENSFVLPKEDAYEIFQIAVDIQIIYGNCHGIPLELFVYDHPINRSFSHVCITISDAQAVEEKAREKGYQTFVRRKNQKETFFIQDSQHHIFEIKNQ